jgi:hypothetical protein
MHTFFVGAVSGLTGVAVGVVFSGKIAKAVKEGLEGIESKLELKFSMLTQAIKNKV